MIVPDAAVRVLLLDFDELPAKPVEALPVVRFRLKKLLPFDADDAAISYQVMATAKGSLQALAVAMPRQLLAITSPSSARLASSRELYCPAPSLPWPVCPSRMRPCLWSTPGATV